MNLQPRVTTGSAFLVGDLHDVSKLKNKNWVIRLHVLEGRGRFIFTDETGEARLIVLASKGVKEIRSSDYAASLPGDKLRLCVADPIAGAVGENKSMTPRVTYSCSIT